MKPVGVTGIKENIHALDKAGDVDTETAGTEAARSLLPFIESETRTETGRMRGGWDARDSAFINTVEYSPFQEFGTVNIYPTNAIQHAMEKNEDRVIKAYEKEVDRATSKAGFGR